MKNLSFLMLFYCGFFTSYSQEIDSIQNRRLDSLEQEMERLDSIPKKIYPEEKNNFFKRLFNGSKEPKYYSDSRSFPIIINFKERKIFKVPKNIKKGDYYDVQVKDINLNRYAVLVNSKDTVFSSELSMPTFSDIGLEAISTLTEGFSDLHKSDTLSIEKKGDSLIYLSKKLLVEGLKDKDIVTILDEYEILTKRFADSLTSQARRLDALKFKIYEHRLNMFKELPTEGKFDSDEALQKFILLREQISETQSQLEKINNQYFEFLEWDDVQAAVKNNEVLKKRTEEIKSSFKALKDVSAELSKAVNAENVQKLLKSVIFLSTKNTFQSLPIQFKGEQETLSISFVPKDSTSGLQKEVLTPLVFPIHNPGYWSIGTSFYYSNLTSERFSTLAVPVTDSTRVYKIVAESDIDRELGMAVNLRVGRKFKNSVRGSFFNDLGAHFSIGPGVSISKNILPRLLMGAGLSYGRRHNIIMDFGGIIGFVERKRASVDLNGEYAEPIDPIETRIQSGNYFAIGYTFKL